MQTRTENQIDSKCTKLASPRNHYLLLLQRIHRELGEEEKNAFEFWYQDDLPKRVLEARQPLKWFISLEQHGILSWSDVDSLCDYLEMASRLELLSEVWDYQARMRIIVFFSKHLQQMLPALCIENELNKKWSSKEELPEQYLRKCDGLFFKDQNCDAHCLFSKGFLLLEENCRCSNDDARTACLKLVHLSNLFYNRFKKMVVENQRLLNFEPFSDGKCRCDNRQRTPATHEGRSSIRYEPSCEIVQNQNQETRNLVNCLIAIVSGLLTTLVIGMFNTCTCESE